MEFVDEEPHPADCILDIEPAGAPRAVYRSSRYEPFDMKIAAVPQQMPGRAQPGFGDKRNVFDKPGVAQPDLKTAPLVEAKMVDGPEVEKMGDGDARMRRQLYEVSIGPKLRRGAAGAAPEDLDTEAVKQKFSLDSIGAAQLGADDDDSERFRDLSIEWMSKSLIWVCAIEKGRLGVSFYSHVGRPHRFHHSSFTSGGPLLAAGEWIVEKGVLKRISGNSGHYQPSISELHRAVLFMSRAWGPDTEVMVYNTQARNWEYVPVNMFKTDPSGGGKYKAHPSAA